MLSSFAAERDISSQETCHILYSLPLVRSSRKYQHLDVTMNKTSESVNFESSSLEKKSLFDRYKTRPIDRFPALSNVSLLEFATWWDWDHNKYTKRGSRGAKPYVVNVYPRYHPDPNVSDVWEKYCYTKMILHHPFRHPDELLKDHIDWAAAYQSDCLDKRVTVCVPPLHLHMDSLPDTVKDKDDEDVESDSESIPDEDHEADNFRAEWMQEAGRHPNQRVELDFGNLGSRDLDLAYDWNENSPNQSDINAASTWLTDRIKESPNDIAQQLPHVDYSWLKGHQREVFLQVMAYFKKIKAGGANKPDPLRINVDGTAGTGKSFLIWAISIALRDMFHDELDGHDPVVRLAPTGIAAFGIRGWTINYGLMIPVKEGKEFGQLGQNSLIRLQARWKKAKLLILDEKSMVGRAQMGRCDRRLRQAFPQHADEILGDLPAIFLGDFAQLPPIGDTPLYSTKESRKRTALHEEGRRVFESLNQSVTLETVYRQAGQDLEQIKFWDALMRLRTYSTTQEDFDLLSTRTWDNLTPQQRTEFDEVLHLLPTRATVDELNCRHIAALGQPVLRCKAKHNHSEAKKSSDEDADGLEKEILLAEGAKVMLTHNLWTAKGHLNIY